MKIKMRLLAKLGLLPLLAILSVSPVCAQTDLGKTILEKLTAKSQSSKALVQRT